MRNKFKIFIAIVFLGLTFASYASADLVNCGRNEDLPPNPTAQDIKDNQCELGDLIMLVVNIINFLLSWAWLIAVFFITWSGWNMATSGGNEEALSAAKTSFSHAIIGFFLIMASFVLVNFIVSLFTGDGMPRPNAFFNAFNLLGPRE